jgi:hypothetical protein
MPLQAPPFSSKAKSFMGGKVRAHGIFFTDEVWAFSTGTFRQSPMKVAAATASPELIRLHRGNPR